MLERAAEGVSVGYKVAPFGAPFGDYKSDTHLPLVTRSCCIVVYHARIRPL